MGVDFAKPPGHRPRGWWHGRDPDAVAKAVVSRRPTGRQAGRDQPHRCRGGRAGRCQPVRPHRRADQQCRQLLCALLRGADGGADRPAVGDAPHRPDKCHPRRPAGHAEAALWAHYLDSHRPRGLVGFAFCSAYAACRSLASRAGWSSLQQEVAPFGITTTIVNPGFFRNRALEPASVTYAEPSIADYADRAAEQLKVVAGTERPAKAATRPSSRGRWS